MVLEIVKVLAGDGETGKGERGEGEGGVYGMEDLWMGESMDWTEKALPMERSPAAMFIPGEEILPGIQLPFYPESRNMAGEEME